MASSTDRFDPDFVVRQVLKGNKDRFRLIVREYGLLVRGYLASRVYHLEDAEDLAQNAFLVAFSKLPTYEIGTNFRAWLLTIAKFQLTGKIFGIREGAFSAPTSKEAMSKQSVVRQFLPLIRSGFKKTARFQNFVQGRPLRFTGIAGT